MSSSTDNDAANTTTRDKDGDLLLAAEQLALQIEDISIIEKEEGDRPSAMASTNSADNSITCAACGKEGEEDSMNICNKCKMVHYCNVACKKKHKSKHKKKCDRQCKIRAEELHEEALFKEPPLPEDCPICMIPLLPLDLEQITFHQCCGKSICCGCEYAMKEREGALLCPFCRTPAAKSNKEIVKRNKMLMEKGNANACCMLAEAYWWGMYGFPQDRAKANELFLKAGELGCAAAYRFLGNSYFYGNGVEIDMNKAQNYYELAAMNGSVMSRYILGDMEVEAGNIKRAMKHFLISARAGEKDSLDAIKSGFRSGIVTKDEYESTLRAYYERQTEMKSEERDKAARTL